jgi:hypothetical protein
MKFTAEDALQAHEDGEPIMLDWQAVHRMIRAHGQEPADFYTEQPCWPQTAFEQDAWSVLAWLGY